LYCRLSAFACCLNPGNVSFILLIHQTFLCGVFFNSCLPGGNGGDAVKIYYAMEGNKGRRTEIATLVMFDRAIGMFALLIYPLLVLPLFPELYESINP